METTRYEKSRLPTLKEITKLTAFLPKLYSEGFSPLLSWGGGGQKDGVFISSYPIYNKIVNNFFKLASKAYWDDYEYDPEEAGEMIRNDNLIKTASLSQIKTMLTFCVRGERFSDGHWGAMIEEGYIRQLLERLNEFKSEQ